MEKRTTLEQSELVRCLDCGTEYRLPRDNRVEAMPCPTCGGVGWVATTAGNSQHRENS